MLIPMPHSSFLTRATPEVTDLMMLYTMLSPLGLCTSTSRTMKKVHRIFLLTRILYHREKLPRVRWMTLRDHYRTPNLSSTTLSGNVSSSIYRQNFSRTWPTRQPPADHSLSFIIHLENFTPTFHTRWPSYVKLEICQKMKFLRTRAKFLISRSH